MEYEEFREKLGELGFDNEWYHLPYMREEYPQMTVCWVSNPTGIELKVRYNADDRFKVLIIRRITPMESVLEQIAFTIEQHNKNQ